MNKVSSFGENVETGVMICEFGCCSKMLYVIGSGSNVPS